MVPGAKGDRGDWTKELNVKDISSGTARVYFHAGCRTAYDSSLWKTAQHTVRLMQMAGEDAAVGGSNEACCGGRAYQMGYRDEAINQAKKNVESFKKAGIKTLVTGCADCYHAFKVLYDKFGLKGDLEVLHTTEYFARLIAEGKLNPVNPVSMTVTYHDPCHLGRLGEPYVHWEGKEIPGHIRLFDPPRKFMRGTYGVYEPPREILNSIPGLNLVEMNRIREYAWCCGAGGGVTESNPDFAAYTAGERMKEAADTGAEAVVSACPGCEQSFSSSDSSLKVMDIVDILYQSAAGKGAACRAKR